MRLLGLSPVAALAATLLLGSASAGGAQDLRTVEFSRQLRDTLPLQVRVGYAAGKLALRSAEQALLYDVEFTYDPRRTAPTYTWDAEPRVLRLGVRKESNSGGEDRKFGDLRLQLARGVPADLQLELGAAHADLDFSGLHVSRLRLAAGASDATLHWDVPNAVPMTQLDLDAGAAQITASGLANARAPSMRVQVGVGSVELDFGGEWTNDVELDLQLTLGRVLVRVPRDVGVRMAVDRYLASMDRGGLVKRGDAYYSTNWDTAAHKLDIRGRTAFGRFELERGEP
ncbi:MAG TPA: hypothetical protein VHQ45_13150 [Gemmatimonadaceae bacterium]|jgi:hypothetical protein|nr:hypothetical protein [Gemmatimonadaceae bacterium]